MGLTVDFERERRHCRSPKFEARTLHSRGGKRQSKHLSARHKSFCIGAEQISASLNARFTRNYESILSFVIPGSREERAPE
jgi:hypothetical protein